MLCAIKYTIKQISPDQKPLVIQSAMEAPRPITNRSASAPFQASLRIRSPMNATTKIMIVQIIFHFLCDRLVSVTIIRRKWSHPFP